MAEDSTDKTWGASSGALPRTLDINRCVPTIYLVLLPPLDVFNESILSPHSGGVIASRAVVHLTILFISGDCPFPHFHKWYKPAYLRPHQRDLVLLAFTAIMYHEHKGYVEVESKAGENVPWGILADIKCEIYFHSPPAMTFKKHAPR